ncbi:Protein MAIN-LIKE 1 [Glycine max]|nr:Protein MAIN-LIKE 1 [Glycine max]
MVKTRGLGRALGRVVGRGLGRGDGDDSDSAPQHRRPTASARRRRVPVTVADDVPADTDAETGVQDTGAEDVADEVEGFPGGPRDPSVLTEYAEHERPELKLSSHGRKVYKLGRPVPAIEEMVAGTGLSPLITCSVDTGDQGLISSFVERWHRETSTFHLPMGEVSITLDDVASLLHLSIVDDFHAFQPLQIDEAVLMLVELLMVSPELKCQTQHWTAAARAYLLHLLGCTLFYNKSATHVHVVFLDVLRDLTQTRRYAWGAAGLVHLNDASINTSRQVVGYITLLQCWIYEHFPSVVECNVDLEYNEVSPRACRWIATKKTVKKISTATYRQCLDRLRIPDVYWMPYGEHRLVQDFHLISCFLGQLRWGPAVVRYKPERVMRQFGYIQCILAHPVDSWVSLDDVAHYSDHLAPVGDICVVPGQCAPDYIDWFFVISHPFKCQSHEPTPASTHVHSDADEPRHVVETCHVIAETLKHHLSLNEVMPDTSTHEVIQKCFRIVRGVTKDVNVYLRSHRRRHTDQP